MKTIKSATLGLCILFLISCEQKEQKSLDKNVPENVLINRKTLDTTAVCKVVVEKDSVNDLTIYKAQSLFLKAISNKEADMSRVFLRVPCAYTTSDNHIDGFYCENGNIKGSLNKNLSGVVILAKDTCVIKSIEDKGLPQVCADGYTVFQQSLLLLDDRIIPCKIFGNTTFQRRSLVMLNAGES